MQFVNRARLFVSVIVASSATLIAQSSLGTISGVVQDESSAVIAGAKVTVTNVDTGIARSSVSDGSGRYQVSGLNPGRYEVQGESSGFQTEVRKGMTLNVGSEITIPLVLKVGQVQQVTEVTAEASIIETTNATLAGLVDGGTVRDLPLNGRSFDQLIGLESSAPQGRTFTGNGSIGFSAGFTINGAWNTSNVYLMDGLELVGGAVSSVTPGGVLGKNMGVDAVQEFKVMTGSYSAQFGKRAGGIINIATRSGTNQFHGSAYEFLRNAKLDARNFFDVVQSPPPFKRNQFGGTVGGPIRRDQTFFFFNYEGLRDRFSPTNIAIVPDDNARKGLLPCAAATAFPCNTSTGLATVGIAPNAAPYMVLFPAANGPVLGQGLAQAINTPSNPSNQNYFLARIDHRISDKDSLMGRFTLSRADSLTTNPDLYIRAPRVSRDPNLMLQEQRIISPTTINVFRVGFSRGYSTEDSVPVPGGPADNPALAFPGGPFVGRIAFTAGAASGGNAATITEPGTSIANFRHYVANYYDVSDYVSRQAGAHSLTFGGQFQRIQHNVDDNFFKAGAYTFPTLLSFLTGTPGSFTGLNPNQPNCQVGDCANANKGFRQTYVAAFFQDDYKLSRRLTLNLGLRYETMSSPNEVNGRNSNYLPTVLNGAPTVSATPTLGGSIYKASRNLFAPRIGVAWDVFGNGKTAIRAGAGYFYDQIETIFMHVLQNNPPFETVTVITNPAFPNPFAGVGGLPNAEFIDPSLKVPTRLQYNFSIQQQITTNTALTVGYVGAHVTHNLRTTDPNTAVPQVLPPGTAGCSFTPCYFYPNGAPRRNPALAGVQGIVSDGNEIYQGLQVDFVQRLSRGLRSKVSFTYAKNIDDVSQADSALTPCGTQSPQIMDNTRNERGLSCYDVRRNLVVNFTYDLPFRYFNRLPKRLVNGWQLGAIAQVSDGSPFTALSSFNRARDGSRNTAQRPDLVPGCNPIQGGVNQYFKPQCFVLPPAGFYGNVGRNTLTGPGFGNLDVTLEKATIVTERVNVLFRAEFFNILNHANFNFPNKNVFNTDGTYQSTAGRITSTVNSSRQIQFGIKLVF